MPSQPEAQGDILKEFREGTFLSSLDTLRMGVATLSSAVLHVAAMWAYLLITTGILALVIILLNRRSKR